MMDAVLPLLGSDITTLADPLSALTTKTTVSANIAAAAEDFEAMFATQLLKPMFDTTPVNNTFGGGHGEEVMRTFMLQEYGKMIARTGCLGIAPQVKGEMLRAQESAKTRGASFIPTNSWGASNAANTKPKRSSNVSS